MIRALFLTMLIATHVLACSGEPENGSAAGTNSAGMGGSAGSSGSAGSGNTGNDSGSGGAPAADCAGTFRMAQTIAAVPGLKLSSPSVTADELELFYVGADANLVERIWSTRRSSTMEVFPAGSEVAELNAACAPAELRTIDISEDGLRAYIWCSATFSAGQLWVGSRPDRDAPFLVPASPAHASVGPSFAVSSDELTAVSSGLDSSVTPWPPQVYSRASASESFGPPQAVPGLEAVSLSAPDLSGDGLMLVGAASGELLSTRRSSPGAAFGPPETIVFAQMQGPDGGTLYFGAPQLSADCRSLYFVMVIGEDWELMVSERQ